MKRVLSRCVFVALSAFSLGCGGLFGGNDTAEVEVRLTAAGLSPMTASTSGLLADASAAAIDPTDVASLLVTVTDIQFLPAGGEENGNGGWQSLGLGAPAQLELTGLPTAGQSPVLIAAGELEVGEYSMVRFVAPGGTIEFATDLTLGQSNTFDAETPYDVTVPSGSQTGIKTDVSFSVTDDGQGGTNAVDLLFDETATYQNVTATGSGGVSLAPVIRSAPAQ
jgi:hypothetical protein